MRVSTRVALTSLIGLSIGCSSVDGPLPGERVVVAVDKNIYVAGETVVATITNVSSIPLSYSFCPLTLEQMRDGQWVAVMPNVALCTLEGPPPIPPGESRTLQYFLPKGVSSGSSRLVIPSPRGSDEVQRILRFVHTPVFSVLPWA